MMGKEWVAEQSPKRGKLGSLRGSLAEVGGPADVKLYEEKQLAVFDCVCCGYQKSSR